MVLVGASMEQDVTEHPARPTNMLLFVTSTSQDYSGAKRRRRAPTAIRRHVMLNLRRRDRLAAVQDFQYDRKLLATDNTSGNSSVTLIITDENVNSQDKRTRWQDQKAIVKRLYGRTKEHPASWELDPFASFPVKVDKNLHAGLEFYSKVMVPSTRIGDSSSHNAHTHRVISSVMTGGQMLAEAFGAMQLIGKAMNVYAKESNREVMRLLASRKAQALIPGDECLTLSEENQETARSVMATGLVLQNRASRMFNRYVLKHGFTAESTSVGVVVCLMGCELLLGDAAKAEIHSQGLAAIIQEMNGIGNLPDHMFVIAFFTDMHTGTINHRPSNYALRDEYRLSLQTDLPQVCRLHGLFPFRNEALNLNHNLVARLDSTFYEKFIHLQDIVNYTNTFGLSTNIPEDVRNLYLSKIFAVEHGILSHIPAGKTKDDPDIQDFCITVMLLFIYTSIQKWSPFSPLVRILVRQLQVYLSVPTMIRTLLFLDATFLLWSFFVGAYASFGQTNRPWFIAMIRKAVSRLSIETWIDVQELLGTCYYIDSQYDQAFLDIWFEVQGMGG